MFTYRFFICPFPRIMLRVSNLPRNSMHWQERIIYEKIIIWYIEKFSYSEVKNSLDTDVYKKLYAFTQPLRYWQDLTQGQFLSWKKMIWNHDFPSCRLLSFAQAKEPNLLYYLPIAEEEAMFFMFSLRALEWSWKQTTLSKIWTRVVHPIFINNNDNIEHASTDVCA